MGIFIGIALAGDEWSFVQLDANEETATRIDHHPERLQQDLTAPLVFQNLEQATQLRRYLPTECGPVSRSEAEVCEDIAKEIRKANLHNLFKQKANELDVVGVVGICHPYGLSPTVRRGLPALINGFSPIKQSRRNRNEPVAAIHPKNSATASRVCAVETPFAACLEILSRGRVTLPASIVVLADAADGIEATVVAVSANEATLRLAAEEYQSGECDEVIGWLVRRAPAWVGSKLVLAKSELSEESAARVERFLADRASFETVKLTATDFACGAARYAALCAGESSGVLLGTEQVQRFEFQSIAPYAVGVCGQTRDGDSIWCPILEAGELLGAGSCSILLSEQTSIPSRLVFAQHIQRNRIPGEWVTDTSQLRWYAEVSIDVPQNVREGRVDITIESSTDCWSYGWSDPFIRSSFATLSN